MGFLSETKVKRKINHDPNNTKWTRNENTFGQKILRSHGWQPGQYLGAQDAPHAELHGTANASYIRVTLKDDMKGLGFDKAMKDDEITGLDVFTDLLSRLNGKSEESVEKDRAKRLEFKTHRFVEQRYGAMRFVRGGLLVGDELKEDHNDAKPKENKTPEAKEANLTVVDPESSKEKDKKKSSKKRKAASLNEEDEDEDDRDTPTAVSASDMEPKKKRKRDEKRSKKRSTDVSSEDSSSEAEIKSKKKEKKEMKEKKSKKDKSAKDIPAASEEEDEEMIETPDQPVDDSEPTIKSKKSKEERKEEKRLKKLLKEERKAEKKRKRAEAKAQSESSSPEPTSSADVTTASVTPAASGTSTPRNNPHFVRAKFLKAKREAMMDSNAINKIFMMKA